MIRFTILFLLPLVILATAPEGRSRRLHGQPSRVRPGYGRPTKPPAVFTKPPVIHTTKPPTTTTTVVVTSAATTLAAVPLQKESDDVEPEAESVAIYYPDDEQPSQPESLPSSVIPELEVVPIEVNPEVEVKPTPVVVPPAPVIPPLKPNAYKPIIYTPKYTAATQYVTKPPAIISPLQPEPFKTDFLCEEGFGYYTVDNECDSYYLCKHKVATKLWCPDGLHFNPHAKHHEYPCAYPSVAQCVAGALTQNAKPTEQCPRQYGFFPSKDGDCSKYISCIEGSAFYLSCPAGLVFNPILEGCDYEENVPQCYSSVFNNFKCPEPVLDEHGFVSDAIYNFKYGQQCKEYVACQKGYPRLLSCDQGLAFDEVSQSCVVEDYVPGCVSE